MVKASFLSHGNVFTPKPNMAEMMRWLGERIGQDSQGFPFCFFRQVTVTPHDDLLFLPSCKKQVQSKWRSCELIHTGSSKRAHQSERGDLFSGKISARGAELGVVKWSKTKKNR